MLVEPFLCGRINMLLGDGEVLNGPDKFSKSGRMVGDVESRIRSLGLFLFLSLFTSCHRVFVS